LGGAFQFTKPPANGSKFPTKSTIRSAMLVLPVSRHALTTEKGEDCVHDSTCVEKRTRAIQSDAPARARAEDRQNTDLVADKSAAGGVAGAKVTNPS
jgi:hypothetical protein